MLRGKGDPNGVSNATKCNQKWRSGTRPGMKRTASARLALLQMLVDGRSIDQAADGLGVHRATVYRWIGQSRGLQEAYRVGYELARQSRYRPPSRRPSVPSSALCPLCDGRLEVSAAYGGWLRFWRCEHRLACGFMSWRPVALGRCGCGGYRLWSHSRKSIVCVGCGTRQMVRL